MKRTTFCLWKNHQCSLPLPSTPGGWLLLIIIFASILYFPFLGEPLIRTADEGQRSVPPLEMMRSGNWLVPKLNDVIYLKKPPMIYWQVALCYKMFGISEWSARVSVVLCGILLACVTFLWARSFLSDRTSALAGMICVANWLVMVKSRECQIDIPLTLFNALCLWCWMLALRPAAKDGKKWLCPLIIGMCMLGMSNMYKFPVGYVFAVSALLGTPILLWDRKFKLDVRWLFCVLAAVLAAVPVALWAIALFAQLGFDTVLAVWKFEASLHLVKATRINSGPPWYYIVRIISCFIPWILWVIPLFMSSFNREYKQRGVGFEWAYLSAIVLFSIVFLSLNTSKETEYMLGAIVPFCILLSMSFEWLWMRREQMSGWLKYYANIATSPLILIGGIAVWIVAGAAIYPVLSHIDSGKLDPKTISAMASEARHQKNLPVAVYDLMGSRPYVYYYLNELYPELFTEADVTQWFNDHKDGVLLTKTSSIDFLTSNGLPLPPLKRLYETSEKGDLVLLQPE